MTLPDKAEIIIIGGSHAGLSAALVLGRSRRNVLVIDSGQPRNRTVKRAYGYYTRNAEPPLDLIQTGREQLAPYDVTLHTGTVTDVSKTADGFVVALMDGTQVSAEKIVLASGVVDEFPDIEHFQDLWGKHIFTCPYCDGWEMRDKKLVVLGAGEAGYKFALMMKNWSNDVTLCTNGPSDLSPDGLDCLQTFGIPLNDRTIISLDHDGDVLTSIVFKDGQSLACDAIFFEPSCHLGNQLANRLGCEFEKDGRQIATDDANRTCIPGLYAAGDVATKHSHISTAVASGANAAFAINHDIVAEQIKKRVTQFKSG